MRYGFYGTNQLVPPQARDGIQLEVVNPRKFSKTSQHHRRPPPRFFRSARLGVNWAPHIISKCSHHSPGPRYVLYPALPRVFGDGTAGLMRVFLAQQSAGKAIATISRFAGRQTVQIQMRTFIAPTVSRRGTFLFRSPFFFSTTDDIARDLSVASAAKRSSAYYLGIVSVPVVQCPGPGGQEA